jgi:D-serine deaminase-like pyridoxal phosphate-dependent protein
VPAQKWTLFDSGFFFPVMALKNAAIEHNVRTMAKFCVDRGALLAPHGKTTMAPQLFQRQLSAGAWGITAATVEHARVYRAFGVPRILLANELVGTDEARWALAELADPLFDFLCYVDSSAGVRVLSDVFAVAPRKMRVLVELGTPGGRAGCRTNADALALARDIAAAPGLELSGVAGFEGILGASRAPGALEAVDAFCDRLAELAQELLEAMPRSNETEESDPGKSPTTLGSPRRPWEVPDGGRGTGDEFIVSAGGSAYPDRVVERLGSLARRDPRVKVVLRSGCYVTHDHGFYEGVSPFASSVAGSTAHLRPALELWASVLSRPEPALAIVGFGKRDAPFDAGLPVPRAVRSRSEGTVRPVDAMSILRLNDQHAYLALAPDDPLEPGDLLACGVSHPCLAFDKWSLLPSVDDEYNVVEAIRTFF